MSEENKRKRNFVLVMYSFLAKQNWRLTISVSAHWHITSPHIKLRLSLAINNNYFWRQVMSLRFNRLLIHQKFVHHVQSKLFICQFKLDVACGILLIFTFFFSFPTSNFHNALILLPFFTLARYSSIVVSSWSCGG